MPGGVSEDTCSRLTVFHGHKQLAHIHACPDPPRRISTYICLTNECQRSATMAIFFLLFRILALSLANLLFRVPPASRPPHYVPNPANTCNSFLCLNLCFARDPPVPPTPTPTTVTIERHEIIRRPVTNHRSLQVHQGALRKSKIRTANKITNEKQRQRGRGRGRVRRRCQRQQDTLLKMGVSQV